MKSLNAAEEIITMMKVEVRKLRKLFVLLDSNCFGMASTSAIPLDDSPKIELSRDFIREGDNVLIRLPSTIMKAIKITLNSSVILSLLLETVELMVKQNGLIGKIWSI